ncbi:MAG: tRNA 2-thiocytidine biosynthesis protein TtcA, partial [Pseudomonadota bacterium]
FTALHNVVPSHLMDHSRHNFKDIKTTGVPSEDGDKGFDIESFARPSLSGLQLVSA